MITVKAEWIQTQADGDLSLHWQVSCVPCLKIILILPVSSILVSPSYDEPVDPTNRQILLYNKNNLYKYFKNGLNKSATICKSCLYSPILKPA